MTKKARPQPTAANRNRFRSIRKYIEITGVENNNSEVINRISAVIASHKPMSEIERGKFIYSTLIDYEESTNLCS